ncbi:hypothetical protein DFJ73DRAFT_834797 [Zopfochytrium polystomum]|nr:hypothetical protein DFJ73DRAFT_834797 [Zopfochytrium polystomum]
MAKMFARNDLLDTILACGDAAERINKTLVPILRTANTAALTYVPSPEKDPLAILDPGSYTLSYLFILVARLRSEDRVAELSVLLQRTLAFAKSMNFSQAWIAPDQMRMLANILSLISERLGQPAMPILPLFHMILRNPSLSSGVDITAIEKSGFGLIYQDFLLYHYYGGIAYIGLKDFSRALDFFHLVISAPTANAVSLIQIEAYRKSIFVSLLVHGVVAPLPKYTNNNVAKTAQNTSKPFTDFANAFQSGDFDKLQIEIVKHQDILERTKNMGLARQCFYRLARRKILNLNQTYITLPLSDIAREVLIFGSNPDDVEREVLRLIEDGEVLATISHEAGGMVSFQDSSERYDTAATMISLDEDMRLSMELSKRINRVDNQVHLSRDYLSKSTMDPGRVNERFFSGAERFGSGASFDEDLMGVVDD